MSVSSKVSVAQDSNKAQRTSKKNKAVNKKVDVSHLSVFNVNLKNILELQISSFPLFAVDNKGHIHYNIIPP